LRAAGLFQGAWDLTLYLARRPASLRDLPAAIADLTGRPGESPFPGRSLARLFPVRRIRPCPWEPPGAAGATRPRRPKQTTWLENGTVRSAPDLPYL